MYGIFKVSNFKTRVTFQENYWCVTTHVVDTQPSDAWRDLTEILSTTPCYLAMYHIKKSLKGTGYTMS